MKKDTIVQFVCFVTTVELNEFAPKWENYAKKLLNKKSESTLQQQATGVKNKFRYISRHEWPERDFHFTFMKEKWSEVFPEHNVRVIQVGGYIPFETKGKQTEEDSDVKLIAFIGHDENDIDFYKDLPLFRQLNIHQAYYESCSYGYVMEFIVPENDAEELLMLLKKRPGVETGMYKECLVSQN